MSVNNQSSANESTLADCFKEFWSTWVIFNMTNVVLLLPLSVSVLYLGFQRCQRQRSSSSSAAVVTFSDFVTYNMAVMDLIGVLGSSLSIVGGFADLDGVMDMGILVGSFPWHGQMMFPILTSVERYLAVVHPVAYLSLRQTKGVRMRNISTACVWLLCCVGVVFVFLIMEHMEFGNMMVLGEMAFLITAVTFCSLSVLCVLIRPRPGRASGDRVDPSKRRAFNTIMIMMGVLQLRFGGALVTNALGLAPAVSVAVVCRANMFAGWWNLPSSLVLPLLFLHREGKLPGSRHTTESG